jgi:hypothetical protein
MLKDKLMEEVRKSLTANITKMMGELENMGSHTAATFYNYLLTTDSVFVSSSQIMGYLGRELSSVVFEGDYGAASRYTHIVYTFRDGSSVKIKNSTVEHKDRYLYEYLKGLTKTSTEEG